VIGWQLHTFYEYEGHLLRPAHAFSRFVLKPSSLLVKETAQSMKHCGLCVTMNILWWRIVPLSPPTGGRLQRPRHS
jgi:hypothetical protein